VSDTDRLAALLREDAGLYLEVLGIKDDAVLWDVARGLAARLIAAGVTLAATPAPLDQRQHQCTHGHMAAQAILDAAIDVFPEEWVAADSSMAMPVTMRGRDVFALRDALKGADRE